MHHPVRQDVLPKLKGTHHTHFSVSNTERYLSNIVLASAFTERTESRKVYTWIENVRKFRQAALSGLIDTGPKDYDNVALDLAVNAARHLDIRLHLRWIDAVIDATLAVGFGAITSFVLTDWSGFYAGLAEYAVSKKVDLPKQVARAVLDSESRLREMARSEPGRIAQIWN